MSNNFLEFLKVNTRLCTPLPEDIVRLIHSFFLQPAGVPALKCAICNTILIREHDGQMFMEKQYFTRSRVGAGDAITSEFQHVCETCLV
tara:strand:+ start:1167 stop:1433 length:267 start_codon:yes stop_codon:yes gene_type:complete